MSISRINNVYYIATFTKFETELNLIFAFSIKWAHLAQPYTQRGVRNTLPLGTAPREDCATQQATNLISHLNQSMSFNLKPPVQTISEWLQVYGCLLSIHSTFKLFYFSHETTVHACYRLTELFC